jgi:hypothetical protein
MKRLLILLVFSFSGYICHAQSNYVAGYIITNEHDTIHGLIDFRTDRMNAQICRFKSDLSAKEQSFHPVDILGFRYMESGKFYVSKTVDINNVAQTVFLEYLIHGIMNLYFYKDGDLNTVGYYIFEDENGKMQTITKHIDVFDNVQVGNKGSRVNVLKKDVKYKNRLNYMFGKIETVSAKIPKAEFAHKTMIDITKEYHKQVCTTGEECIEFETKVDNKKLKFKFGLYAGYDWISREKYYPSTAKLSAFVFGGRLEISVPRWNKSLSTFLDLSYTKNLGNSEDYNYYFQYQTISKLKFDFGFKYTYHKGIVRPTVEAGISTTMDFYPSPAGMETELWGGFIGAGMDFKVRKDSYVFVLLDYSKTRVLLDGRTALRLKVGYKF